MTEPTSERMPGARSARHTAELVSAAQRGDREAVEDLFSRYLPRVRQIVALRMGRQLRQFTGLDDVAQDVLMKAFRDLDRCANESEGSFRNWLARSVASEIASAARRARAVKRGGGKHREPLLSSLLMGREPTPSEAAQRAEQEERIEQALLALPEHHREVIVLRTLCGMGFEEIAAEMGFRSDANARKAFSRARASLIETLGDD